MQIKDVMTRGVEVLHPDATLEEAAAKMKSHDIGPVPVCDGDRPVTLSRDEQRGGGGTCGHRVWRYERRQQGLASGMSCRNRPPSGSAER